MDPNMLISPVQIQHLSLLIRPKNYEHIIIIIINLKKGKHPNQLKVTTVSLFIVKKFVDINQ